MQHVQTDRRPSLGFIVGKDLSLEEERRWLLLVLFLSLGIPTLYVFAIYHLLAGTYFLAGVDLVTATGLLVTLLFLRKIKSGLVLFRVCTALFAFLCFVFANKGGAEGSMSLWLFIFPIIAFFLLGKREGLLWTGIVFTCLVSLFTVGKNSQLETYPYPTGFVMRYYICFVMISCMSYIFESTREIYQRRTEREHQALLEEQRKLAAEKQKADSANKQLSDSLQTLRVAQSRLIQTEKMAALGGLVAGISHEINTPLGVSITATSFLEDRTKAMVAQYTAGELGAAQLQKYVQIADEATAMILSNLNRAAELVKSFKLIAADQTSEEKRRFNLKEYVEQVLFSLQPKYKRTGHVLHLDCPEDIEIKGYPGALSQMLTNLIMNSLIHGFDGIQEGEIRLVFFVEHEWVVLSYTDNGRGMDLDTLNKTFDPFFTTKRTHGGTGLGMSIVYNLITQSMGGNIECTSSSDEGVVFLIRIPLQMPGEVSQETVSRRPENAIDRWPDSTV